MPRFMQHEGRDQRPGERYKEREREGGWGKRDTKQRGKGENSKYYDYSRYFFYNVTFFNTLFISYMNIPFYFIKTIIFILCIQPRAAEK